MTTRWPLRFVQFALLVFALSSLLAQADAVESFSITTAGGSVPLGNQTAGVPFTIRITKFTDAVIDSAFTGPVAIVSDSGTAGDVRSGGLTATFVNGVLDNHQVVLGVPGGGRHLAAVFGSISTSGQSAAFSVANDQPVLVLDGGQLDYTGNSGERSIAPAATVTDVASQYGNFYAGGVLTVSVSTGGQPSEDVLLISAIAPISVLSGAVRWNGTTIGTYVGGLSGSDLVITLNAAAEPARVTALIQHIAFLNLAGPAPTTGLRTVSFTLSDGDGGTSVVVSRLVNVTLGNLAPVLAVNNVLSVPRTASVSINSLSVLAATDGDHPPTALRFTVKTFPLHGRFFLRSGGTESATLSPTGTTTFTQSDLNAGLVFYEHFGDLATSDNAVLFVTDGANAVTPDAAFAITITGVSSNPAIALTAPGPLGLVALEGAPAVRISPAVAAPPSPTVTDGDSLHYRGATLEAQFLTATDGDDGLAGDVITVLPQLSVPGLTPGLTLAGSNITCTPIIGPAFVLGTIDATLNGQDGRKLLIRFSTAVSNLGAEVITTNTLALLVANLGYACTSDQPVTRTRRLVLTLRERSPNPGIGSTAQDISIDSVNDAPAFTVPSPSPLPLTTLIGVPVVARVLAVDSDLLPGESLLYTIATPPAGEGTLAFNSATGAFSFTPASTAPPTVTLTASAQDGQGATSTPATISITVLPAPTGTPPLVISDPPFEIQESAGLFQVVKIDLNGATGGALGVTLIGNPPPGTTLTVSPADPLTWLLTCSAVARPADGCWCFGLRLVVGTNSGHCPITLSVRSLGGSN